MNRLRTIFLPYISLATDDVEIRAIDFSILHESVVKLVRRNIKLLKVIFVPKARSRFGSLICYHEDFTLTLCIVLPGLGPHLNTNVNDNPTRTET